MLRIQFIYVHNRISKISIFNTTILIQLDLAAVQHLYPQIRWSIIFRQAVLKQFAVCHSDRNCSFFTIISVLFLILLWTFCRVQDGWKEIFFSTVDPNKRNYYYIDFDKFPYKSFKIMQKSPCESPFCKLLYNESLHTSFHWLRFSMQGQVEMIDLVLAF